MKYKLMTPQRDSDSPIEHILLNRGIPFEELDAYLMPTNQVVNSYWLFGEDNMKSGGKIIKDAIDNNLKMFLPVDCDMDGYTSAALFLNYLYNISPEYVKNNITWWHHEGKQHGLCDCVKEAKKYDVVVLLDSSSNDYEYHKELQELNIPVLVADHHKVSKVSPYAITINNQLSDYPNKALSGVGVTWQFCRFLDENIFHTGYADKYLDLVAAGLVGDVMSLRSIETKYLISQGFKEENVRNPFIYYIAQKNSFSIGDHISPIGAAFYIVPFVNAVTRSGTQQEKELIFDAMLNFKAFEIIPSTKRGCKGQTEQLVEQAIRTATNVKARQTREQDKAVEFLESKIEKEHLLDHKVLLFLLQPGDIAPGLAGLVANKLMAKYQRPCCVLTETKDEDGDFFSGSARGYSKSGIKSFKEICESFGGNVIHYAQG